MDNDYCIFEFDNFITKEKCTEIIERFESDPGKRECYIYRVNASGKMEEIIDKKRKDGMDIHIDAKNKNWLDIFVMLLKTFATKASTNIVEKFCKHFEKYGEEPNTIRDIWFKNGVLFPTPSFTINRTNPHSEYAWHHDSMDPHIHFTGLIYLNDIKPENGGATEFLHGKKIQPVAGKLVLFPAVWSNPHRGMFVTENKYMITFGVGIISETLLKEVYSTLT